MPAVTVDDLTALSRAAGARARGHRSPGSERDDRSRGFEGEGFPVRRAFAGVDGDLTHSSTWIRWVRSSTPPASPKARLGTRIADSRRSRT